MQQLSDQVWICTSALVGDFWAHIIVTVIRMIQQILPFRYDCTSVTVSHYTITIALALLASTHRFSVFWNLNADENRPRSPFISGTEVEDLRWVGGESLVTPLPLSEASADAPCFLTLVTILPTLCRL